MKTNINNLIFLNSEMSNITQNRVNMLIPLTNNYKTKLTQSDISRITKIPQQSLSRYLNSYVKEGIIEYNVEGRNKLFYINSKNNLSLNTFQLIENQKTLLFQQKVKNVSIILSELLNYTEAIILFGSYSKYEQTKNSDLDLILVGKSNKEKIKELKRNFPIEINEEYLSFEELKKAFKSNNPLAIELLNNHVLFGDISKIVKLFMERY
jgi:predicted nucleotidyltransferase